MTTKNRSKREACKVGKPLSLQYIVAYIVCGPYTPMITNF